MKVVVTWTLNNISSISKLESGVIKSKDLSESIQKLVDVQYYIVFIEILNSLFSWVVSLLSSILSNLAEFATAALLHVNLSRTISRNLNKRFWNKMKNVALPQSTDLLFTGVILIICWWGPVTFYFFSMLFLKLNFFKNLYRMVYPFQDLLQKSQVTNSNKLCVKNNIYHSLHYFLVLQITLCKEECVAVFVKCLHKTKLDD